MNEEWEMTVNLRGSSFDLLKRAAVDVLQGIASARSEREIPIFHCTGDGINHPTRGFSVSYKTSTMAKIALLRQEADELERQMNSPSSPEARGASTGT